MVDGKYHMVTLDYTVHQEDELENGDTDEPASKRKREEAVQSQEG